MSDNYWMIRKDSAKKWRLVYVTLVAGSVVSEVYLEAKYKTKKAALAACGV